MSLYVLRASIEYNFQRETAFPIRHQSEIISGATQPHGCKQQLLMQSVSAGRPVNLGHTITHVQNVLYSLRDQLRLAIFNSCCETRNFGFPNHYQVETDVSQLRVVNKRRPLILIHREKSNLQRTRFEFGRNHP